MTTPKSRPAQCYRCGHTWQTRARKPRCPTCRWPYVRSLLVGESYEKPRRRYKKAQ